MKKNFKDRLNLLGLNYTKEIMVMVTIFIVFAIGGVSLILFLKETYIGMFVAILGVVFDFFYYSRYSSLERKLEKEHIDELILLLSYFEIFTSNGNNVYQSFKMLIPYSSTFMEDALTTMLNQIDQDKSVGPYINFALKFNSHIVETLMLSIYQSVDNGDSPSQFNEFDVLFTNIRNKFQEDLIDRKKKSLETLNSFPLFGAGLLTITLSISVISVIGEYINVV